MKLYNFTLQKNLNYYFIVIYTQINFRLFKSFNFLPKNFIKKYISLVWFDLNYKSEVNNTIKANLISNCKNYFNITSFKVLCNQSSICKYTKYLEISVLNFNVNRSVFNSLKQFSLKENLNINVNVEYNIISILLNSINFIYIIKFFNKINYLVLFKNYNALNHLNFKQYDKVNLQKNSLNVKSTFNLNFKFL